MAIGRYTFAPLIRGGMLRGDVSAIERIRAGIKNGTIGYNTTVVAERQRLDHFAANAYGDASLWWVIAAASNIGWGLQVPPGTILRIPSSLADILKTVT
jgi:nucleoid-associated protein YgaU